MAKSYKVVGQAQTTDFAADGTATAGVNIMIRTVPSDVPLTVFVPQAQYTPDQVGALLEAAADNTEAIHTL